MGRSWTHAQEAAMNLRDKTLLVSAAAGSGKTSVLTERIIRSLTDPQNPADLSRLLVVTFTRAAAAELKGRIADALTKAMAKDPGNKHLSRQLFLLGSAQISTIDSFFQKAVRANFEQLSLPASFRMADTSEVRPIATDTMDGLIEEFYRRNTTNEEGSGLFSGLESNAFAQAMDHLMSGRSDGKLNSILEDFFNKFSSDPDGIESLGKCAQRLEQDAEKDFLSTSYGCAVKEYLLDLFDGYLQTLEQTQAHLESAPDMNAACSGIVASDLQYCVAMQTALLNDGYERVREVGLSFVKGRFPTVKNKTDEVLFYQTWRDKFKKTVTEKVQPLLLPTAQEITLQMQKTASLAHTLYVFYKEYQVRMISEKLERGILEFDDVRSMLYHLLSNADGTPTPFAEELAAQYDAVYIDEYQDVDFLQDRIFALIGKNRRFMVGDIKQSIYGFRGSEPSIFANYRRRMPLHTDAGAEDAEENCVFMSENFRCDAPVIRFANRVCSFLFSSCENSVGYRPQDDLVCSKQMPDPLAPNHPVPVTLAVFDALPRAHSDEEEDETPREEAVWVAAEISRLLREEQLDNGDSIRPCDIAILVRNKSHGAAYTEELNKLSIPVASAAASDLTQEPLLFDLLNLLKSIDNPYRDIPFSEFLLSEFGGFTLEELTEIRQNADIGVSLYDAMQATLAIKGHPLTEKCATLLSKLEQMRKISVTQPADRFLRLLYRDESLAPYAKSPAFLFLYEQARIYQKTAFCGLYGFLSHLFKLLEGGSISAGGFSKEENAVTIMTVHHSKGLEFPVVFLSSIGSQFNKDDTKQNLLYHRDVGCASRLYNPVTGNLEDSILRSALKLKIDAEQTEESIRTLYVALTRARERMYVSGTLRGKWENAISSASLIRRGNRASILSASNMLAWILASVAQDERAAEEIPCKVLHVAIGEAEEGIPYSALPEQTSSNAAIDNASKRYAETAAAQKQLQYPLDFLQGLPTKAAASKLCDDLLDRLNDEADDAGIEAQIELMQSATEPFEHLLQAQQKPSATDVGTATHAFLEFCDFRALATRTVEEEAARLTEEGFLSQGAASILHKGHLNALRCSDLMHLISQAKQIRREQKFGILVPMSSLTKSEELKARLEDQKLFVQGSIDLLLTMEDDRLILVDYKTDHISDAERKDLKLLQKRMRAAHGNQLAAYAQAVHELFGRAPDEIYIYSLPLGGCIRI
ncbi:MAG: UvrD-helicase domain-containing protein [Clostridia bacterium]|nr:UvrD-helicase domain-containing protein [Clostridia bacterium]